MVSFVKVFFSAVTFKNLKADRPNPSTAHKMLQILGTGFETIWLSLFCRVDATIFWLRQPPKQFCEIGRPLHLLDDLTEPPSLLQIDSKNPLGVQRMGLPRCSKAFSEPFVLDRCRTSLLFDAIFKSHANRFQRSVGYSNSASSMLFKRIFGTVCARFIDATPLSCDLAEPPSLLQTAIAYPNRASSMSFIFSCLTHSQVYSDRFQEYICEIDCPLCCFKLMQQF